MKRLVCASLFVVTALAFGPSSASAADPEKVHELLDVMGMPKMIEAIQAPMLPELIKMLTSAERQRHSSLPPDAPEIVSEAVRDTVKPMVPDILAMDQKILSDSLTDQELGAATAFYRTSAGQSLLKKMPKAYVSGQPPTLTDEERAAAIAFYGSPVGQSFRAKLPVIMQQFDQAGQTWMTHHAGEFDRRFDQLLHRRHPEIK